MSADEDTPEGGAPGKSSDSPPADARPAGARARSARPAEKPAQTPAKGAAPAAETVGQRLSRLRGSLSPASETDRRAPASGDAPVPARIAAVPADQPAQAALPAPANIAEAEVVETQPLPPQRAPALPPPQQQAPTRPVRPAAARSSADTVPAPAILLPVTKRPLLRRGRRRISSSRAALLSMTSQEAPLAEQHEERDLLELCEVALMRLASIAWLAAAVLIWGRLIGYGGADATLFWHSLSSAFVPTLVAAILAPIVSVGLWLVSSWGAVIWAAAVTVSLAAALFGLASPPFGIAGLAANIAALAVIGTIAGVRAWRDRDFDD